MQYLLHYRTPFNFFPLSAYFACFAVKMDKQAEEERRRKQEEERQFREDEMRELSLKLRKREREKRHREREEEGTADDSRSPTNVGSGRK